MEQQQQRKRNFQKEVGFYLQENMRLTSENIALKAAIEEMQSELDNLWETVRKKETESTKEK